jgi:mRNA-degrading endonuclease HigB of HigAB toxin-antitoxin module
MRVAGKLKLIRLVRDEPVELCAPVRALCAEFENANWRSPQEAIAAYPQAQSNSNKLTIPLGERHCVVVAISYRARVVLIEYAGLRSGAASANDVRTHK